VFFFFFKSKLFNYERAIDFIEKHEIRAGD